MITKSPQGTDQGRRSSSAGWPNSTLTAGTRPSPQPINVAPPATPLAHRGQRDTSSPTSPPAPIRLTLATRKEMFIGYHR